ncbi:OLC1v1000773C2 [Oldenlandia corymbosa var. corymbosa]|uniref:OLC1v1000773C2 n=1 Tax=Oldenlandia corymbosa var. corymbosa TaxID=529605 RepID=A0AAV1D768_OLDCO|nr:OLC1v1000773C2 [Oldenlandia corymbosa var. corymbosa]
MAGVPLLVTPLRLNLNSFSGRSSTKGLDGLVARCGGRGRGGCDGVSKIVDKTKQLSLLEKYGTNLTELAKEGKLKRVIGRRVEVELVIRTLCRKSKNNIPVLIGEDGVGKTAIVECFSQRIANGDVPETLRGKEVIKLDMRLLLAEENREERLKKLMEEIKQSGDTILFIDDVQKVFGVSEALEEDEESEDSEEDEESEDSEEEESEESEDEDEESDEDEDEGSDEEDEDEDEDEESNEDEDEGSDEEDEDEESDEYEDEGSDEEDEDKDEESEEEDDEEDEDEVSEEDEDKDEESEEEDDDDVEDDNEEGGGGGGILKSALSRGELQCIGATSYDWYIEDPALERHINRIKVSESSVQETVEILKALQEQYETHHNVRYTDESLVTAAKLSYYFSDRYLPDKAIDLMDDAGSRARFRLTHNHAQVQEQVTALETELGHVTADKLKAVEKQDYEKACELRDRERDLKAQISALNNKEINEAKTESRGAVTDEDVRDTLMLDWKISEIPSNAEINHWTG